MEDSKIIDLYWERNEKAISATGQKYGSYCYYIAYNILHDQEDADESVNDTYLGAWNAIPPHRPNMLRTFLGKITRSISLKKWRDAHRDKRGGDEVSLVLDELSECVPSNLSVIYFVHFFTVPMCYEPLLPFFILFKFYIFTITKINTDACHFFFICIF